jgi:hypothetical protein
MSYTPLAKCSDNSLLSIDILSWHESKGFIPVPMSCNPIHIEQNLTRKSLKPQELTFLDSLPQKAKLQWDPKTVVWLLINKNGCSLDCAITRIDSFLLLLPIFNLYSVNCQMCLDWTIPFLKLLLQPWLLRLVASRARMQQRNNLIQKIESWLVRKEFTLKLHL